MLFCDVFRKTVEPLSGSGRLISGEYDNTTKPCVVQAILESLMSLRSAWARYQTVRRQKENISMLPYFLTYSILLSPTSQRLAVHPLSPERETCCLLFISEAMAFLLSLSVSSSVMLSFVPPYCNQLSPIFDGPPFLSRKELRFAS